MNDLEKSEEGSRFLDTLEVWNGKKDFGIESMAKVMAYLGNPQDKPNSFHVAGTNGKGSVSAMIASILSETGGSVGLNISPHLSHRNERFLVNGKPLSDYEVGLNSYKVKEAVESLGEVLTYHEAITAIAFMAFKDLDYSVIEVGLGGRLDSSNVLSKPVASVITSISHDHNHILGNTLEEIAFEKAGIAKKGVPVIVGSVSPSVLTKIEESCNNEKAKLISYKADYSIIKKEGVFLETDDGLVVDLECSLNGDYQLNNASLAVRACLELSEINPEVCSRGLKKVKWPGRLETIEAYSREILLDCCHNESGSKFLAQYINSHYRQPVELIFGCLQTKNAEAMVEALKNSIVHWNIIEPDSHRAMPVAELANLLSCSGISFTIWNRKYKEIIEEVAKSAGKPLVIAGSIYLVGQLRPMLVGEEFKIWE